MGKFDFLFELDRCILGIGGRLLSLSRIPLYIKNSSSLRNNKMLKQKKNVEKCYVCGLGPSLRNIDLSKLDGDTIVVNRFYKFPNNFHFKPTFYCLIDEGFYNGESVNDLRKAFTQYPNTCFVLNGKYKRLINRMFKEKSDVYYAFIGNGYLNKHSSIDFTKILPIVNNVVLFSILLALFLEYKEIILLGCDFNSFASLKPSHCYKDKEKERKWSMAFELFIYSFAADLHMRLNEYAVLHNIKIINATKGSLIDAYPRDESISNFLSKHNSVF